MLNNIPDIIHSPPPLIEDLFYGTIVNLQMILIWVFMKNRDLSKSIIW